MADSSKPAGEGKASKRKADELQTPESMAEALKMARKAKERGNLRKANKIMRDFRSN